MGDAEPEINYDQGFFEAVGRYLEYIFRVKNGLVSHFDVKDLEVFTLYDELAKYDIKSKDVDSLLKRLFKSPSPNTKDLINFLYRKCPQEFNDFLEENHIQC